MPSAMALLNNSAHRMPWFPPYSIVQCSSGCRCQVLTAFTHETHHSPTTWVGACTPAALLCFDLSQCAVQADSWHVHTSKNCHCRHSQPAAWFCPHTQVSLARKVHRLSNAHMQRYMHTPVATVCLCACTNANKHKCSTGTKRATPASYNDPMTHTLMPLHALHLAAIGSSCLPLHWSESKKNHTTRNDPSAPSHTPHDTHDTGNPILIPTQRKHKMLAHPRPF